MTSAGEPVPIPHGPFHAPPSPTHVIAALRIARGRVFAPRRSAPAYRHVHAIHPVVPAPSHTERSPSAPTCQPHRTLRCRRAPSAPAPSHPALPQSASSHQPHRTLAARSPRSLHADSSSQRIAAKNVSRETFVRRKTGSRWARRSLAPSLALPLRKQAPRSR